MERRTQHTPILKDTVHETQLAIARQLATRRATVRFAGGRR